MAEPEEFHEEVLLRCDFDHSALSGESAEQQLQSILSIPSHMKVGFACRLGYVTARTSTYI